MRKVVYSCSVALLAASIVGCSGETTTIRKETVRSVPAPVVVEKQTTVQRTIPSDEPVVIEKKTTVNRGVEERTTTTVEEQ
jgi:hypothetical protein